MDDTRSGRPAWGDDDADLRAVVAAQRDTIARLQRERDRDRATIERLEAALQAGDDGGHRR